MWGVSQRVTPANREATVHPSSLWGWPLKRVLLYSVHVHFFLESVKNLHFSETVNENVQRIKHTTVVFYKQFKIEHKFLSHFQTCSLG